MANSAAILGSVIVILVILFFLVTGYSREIAGLKAENAALRERLSLAHDAHAIVAQQVEILTKEAEQLSYQIAQKDTIDHLAYTSDTVTGTVLALSNTDDVVASRVRLQIIKAASSGSTIW